MLWVRDWENRREKWLISALFSLAKPWLEKLKREFSQSTSACFYWTSLNKQMQCCAYLISGVKQWILWVWWKLWRTEPAEQCFHVWYSLLVAWFKILLVILIFCSPLDSVHIDIKWPISASSCVSTCKHLKVMLFVSMSFKPACKVFTEKCFISHSVITINENLPDRSEETVELATRAANIGNALLLSEDVCLPRRICYGQRSDIVLKR